MHVLCCPELLLAYLHVNGITQSVLFSIQSVSLLLHVGHYPVPYDPRPSISKINHFRSNSDMLNNWAGSFITSAIRLLIETYWDRTVTRSSFYSRDVCDAKLEPNSLRSADRRDIQLV
jgi:hypothetical protein